MRQVFGVVVALSVLLGGAAGAAARCGKQPGDMAALAAVEATVASQCSCCGPRSTFVTCVASALKSALRARALAGRCVSTVRRDVLRACPLLPTTIACRVCNADAECGLGEFCECRSGSCSTAGGVCVTRPQVCPDVVAPVCACNGTTYANDCLRQEAGACLAHPGACQPAGGCMADADCNDGNPCTADLCVAGTCEHACVCADATGASSCCPGPAALCVRPCGMDAAGVCGGVCLGPKEVCAPSAAGCVCTSTNPTCGDTFPACNGSCPAGSSCKSLTGAPACQCVPETCQPGDGTFFYTCGDPVCGGPRPHPGVPPCTTEQVGETCSCLGEECDPGDACGRLLECAQSDPTHGGLCPISRRRYKQNIAYLSAQDVKRLHDEILNFRLASYQYDVPGNAAATHLGFIIDDVEPSVAVAPNGDTVDLYGYTSMAVAAVQEQAREIDQLKREVEILERQVKNAQASRPTRHARR